VKEKEGEGGGKQRRGGPQEDREDRKRKYGD
jgi:hypothetical protein